MTAQARPPEGYPHHLWVGRLEEAREELGAFIEASEEEFAAFGAALEGCMTRAGIAADAAQKAVALTLHRTIEGAAERFQGRLRDLEAGVGDGQRFLEDVEGRIGDILTTLREASALERHFRSAVRALRALSVTTRVESARVDGGQSEFVNLADQVHALSRSIDERFKEVKTRAQTLGHQVSGGLHAVREAEGVQRERLGWAVDELRSGFERLTEAARQSSEVAETIERRARQVADRVGGVVVSLQAQDQTRQRLEHVRDSLGDLCCRFASPGDDVDPVAVAKVVLPLQERQLHEARCAFTGATTDLLGDLEELGDIVGALSSDLEGGRDSGGPDTTRFLQDLAETVRRIAASVGEAAERNAATAALLQDAAGEAATMGRFVREIEDIGDQLGLLAINAVVQANRAGAQGRTLGAVAQEIQTATLAARHHTAALSKLLHRIRTSAEGLGSVAETHAETTRERVEGAGKRLEDLVEDLGGADAGLQNGLAVVLEEGAGLGQELRAAADTLTLHQRLRALEGRVTRTLQTVTEEVMGFGPETDALPSDVLAELETRYTMASQRAVHRSNLDSGQAPAEADDLGDNIELF